MGLSVVVETQSWISGITYERWDITVVKSVSVGKTRRGLTKGEISSRFGEWLCRRFPRFGGCGRILPSSLCIRKPTSSPSHLPIRTGRYVQTPRSCTPWRRPFSRCFETPWSTGWRNRRMWRSSTDASRGSSRCYCSVLAKFCPRSRSSPRRSYRSVCSLGMSRSRNLWSMSWGHRGAIARVPTSKRSRHQLWLG